MDSLGIKESERYGYGSPCCQEPAGKKKKPKDPICFPGSTFYKDQIDAAGLKKAQVGDKFTMNVEITVRALEQRTNSSNEIHREVRFDITACDKAVADGKADEDGDGKDDASEEASGKEDSDSTADYVSPKEAALDD